MSSDLKRTKFIYEQFCKLQTRNTVRKRGAVVTRQQDDFYTSEKAADNFFNAIMKAESQTSIERVMLVALRELSSREVSLLRERLKKHYFDCLQAEEVLA